MADPEISLTIDTSRMDAALAQYLAKSRHSVAFVINRKLFHIAKRAYEDTPVAKRSRILETFNVTQRERTVKKGKRAGSIRRVTNYAGLNRSAFAIMNWKRRKVGKAALHGAEALNAAKRMVASRLRAVGSLKSGWVGGIVKLKRQLQEAFTPDFKNRLNNPGDATTAHAGSPMAEIAYRLAIKKKSGEQIDPRVVAALQKAFDAEAADTLAHLANELQKEADKVNAK